MIDTLTHISPRDLWGLSVLRRHQGLISQISSILILAYRADAPVSCLAAVMCFDVGGSGRRGVAGTSGPQVAMFDINWEQVGDPPSQQ